MKTASNSISDIQYRPKNIYSTDQKIYSTEQKLINYTLYIHIDLSYINRPKIYYCIGITQAILIDQVPFQYIILT